MTKLLTYVYRRQAAVLGGDTAYLFVPHHQDYQRLASFWSKYPTLGEKDPRAKTHAVMKLGALLNRIRFLVENSYVTFGGEVFKQEIGIAMGLIPAGAIASLVCYSYELDYLNRCLKKWKSITFHQGAWLFLLVFCSAEPSNAESLLLRAYILAPAASASP